MDGACTASASIGVLDLESAVSANDPYGSPEAGLSDRKTAWSPHAVAQGATDGGAIAVLEAYHATLVAPFCLAATKRFFVGSSR